MKTPAQMCEDLRTKIDAIGKRLRNKQKYYEEMRASYASYSGDEQLRDRAAALAMIFQEVADCVEGVE